MVFYKYNVHLTLWYGKLNKIWKFKCAENNTNGVICLSHSLLSFFNDMNYRYPGCQKWVNVSACFTYTCLSSTDPRVRLAGGPNRYEGFPEIWYRGRWSTACDLDSFTDENAAVICKMIFNTSKLMYVLLYNYASYYWTNILFFYTPLIKFPTFWLVKSGLNIVT